MTGLVRELKDNIYSRDRQVNTQATRVGHRRLSTSYPHRVDHHEQDHEAEYASEGSSADTGTFNSGNDLCESQGEEFFGLCTSDKEADGLRGT